MELIKETEILHHGYCKGQFKPIYTGTDYFCFVHKPCESGEGRALSDITHVLIDNDGRIIFNLECRICHTTDALKTHPFFRRRREAEVKHRAMFHFSPKLRGCIGKHEWDDY